MPRHPLVTVVMPSYDRPFLLKTRSIPSVLRQSYQNWELIVVGDGPEDDAIERVVVGFGDRRIRYAEIARPDYTGLSSVQLWHVAGAAARNHALALASGDVVCPLDDDDEFLPHHLEDCVRAVCDRGFDFVYGTVLLRDLEAGTELVESLPVPSPGRRRLPFDDSIYHSTVGFTGRLLHLRYPTDGAEPDDFGLWKQMYRLRARFGRLTRPQSVSYGESLRTLYRTSGPAPADAPDRASDVEAVSGSRSPSVAGSCCDRFEAAIGDLAGSPAMALSSYADAWSAALAAVAIGADPARRQIIVPAYGELAVVRAARDAGLEPVLCDVDPRTLCSTPAIMAPLITPAVVAIVPVDAHGAGCDLNGFDALARARGVMVLADVTAGFGPHIGGRHAGHHGDLVVVGLGDRDPLACGGGAVVYGRAAARLLEHVGALTWGPREAHVGLPRLDEIRAARGLARLASFDAGLTARARGAARYANALAPFDSVRFVADDRIQGDAAIVFDSPASAECVVRRLTSCRVETNRGRPLLLSDPHWSACRHGDLTYVSALAGRIVCVPLYDEIRDDLVDLVSGVILDEIGATRRPRARAVAS
jgi:dTDP-4-amino-4,6-dideoxygalactose transaminase